MLLVVNQTKQTSLGNKIERANTFFTRLKGLLGCKGLAEGEGLLLEPCQSVHGLGMSFSCEIIYLDKENRVIHLQTLSPGKLGPFQRKSTRILEVPIGTISYSATDIGDLLKVQEHNR